MLWQTTPPHYPKSKKNFLHTQTHFLEVPRYISRGINYIKATNINILALPFTQTHFRIRCVQRPIEDKECARNEFQPWSIAQFLGKWEETLSHRCPCFKAFSAVIFSTWRRLGDAFHLWFSSVLLFEFSFLACVLVGRLRALALPQARTVLDGLHDSYIWFVVSCEDGLTFMFFLLLLLLSSLLIYFWDRILLPWITCMKGVLIYHDKRKKRTRNISTKYFFLFASSHKCQNGMCEKTYRLLYNFNLTTVLDIYLSRCYIVDKQFSKPVITFHSWSWLLVIQFLIGVIVLIIIFITISAVTTDKYHGHYFHYHHQCWYYYFIVITIIISYHSLSYHYVDH